MTAHRRIVAFVSVLGLLAAGAAAAFAQGVPNVPGVPTVPGAPEIPAVPGQEKARFKVVVEGSARSSVEAAGSGDGGALCNVEIKKIDIDERVKYGRGKGVTMEFVRFKVGGRTVVSLQRGGRIGDASFAVRGTISRLVDPAGLVTRTPLNGRPESTCPSATDKPAASAGCNREFPLSADMKLVYGAPAGTLKLTPTGKETLGDSSPVGECPESPISPLRGLVDRPWPIPAVLPAERLSTRTIFGGRTTPKRKSFKVVFRAVKPAKTEPMIVLKGSVTTSSSHDAVVRFTRLP